MRRAARRSARTGSVSHRQRLSGQGNQGASPRTCSGVGGVGGAALLMAGRLVGCRPPAFAPVLAAGVLSVALRPGVPAAGVSPGWSRWRLAPASTPGSIPLTWNDDTKWGPSGTPGVGRPALL